MTPTSQPSPSRFQTKTIQARSSSTHSATSSSSSQSKNEKPSYERRSRLRVWLKNSMTPASPSAFSESHQQDHDNALNQSNHDSLTVSNIDQALETNYKLTDLDITEMNDEKEDWVFEIGFPDDYDAELERTKQLMAQLAQSPLDFWKDSKDLEEEWQWKYGTTGKQEFKFASFEASFEANFEDEEQENNPSVQASNNDNGGEKDVFANESPSTTKPSKAEKSNENDGHTSDDDFGDFQQFEGEDGEEKKAESIDEVQPEARDDAKDDTKDDTNASMDSDDSDFGEFQEAPPTPDKTTKAKAIPKQAEPPGDVVEQEDASEKDGANDKAAINPSSSAEMEDGEKDFGEFQECEPKQITDGEDSMDELDLAGEKAEPAHLQVPRSLESSTCSSTRPPFHTPKSTDGVSTLLNDFQLDFQDFPTPNTLLANAAAAAAFDAAGDDAETASIDQAMQENNPQDSSNSSIEKLRMPNATSPTGGRKARGNVLTPRNYQTVSTPPADLEVTTGEGNLSSPQKASSMSEPITPIIHNQSARKAPPGERIEGLDLPRYVDNVDQLDPPSIKPVIGSASSPMASEASEREPEQALDDDGSSSVPSVVRIVSAAKPQKQSLAIDPPPPPTESLPYLTEEQHAYYNSPRAMKTPVGRFMRRLSSSRMEMDREPIAEDESEDDSDDGGSLASLQKYYYDEQDDKDQDKHILQVLKKLEWEWIPYWQWDSLLYPVNPNTVKRPSARDVSILDESESDEELEDWMIESKAIAENKVLASKTAREKTTASEDSIPLFQNELVQLLSDLDSANVQINKRQHRRIQPHAGRIEEANALALEMSKNLQICNMYMQRSMNSVALARNGQQEGEGVNGAMDIVESWNNHAAYTELQDLLEQIERVTESEKGLVEAIETFDPREEELCQSILKTLLELNNVLNEDPLSKLQCLDSMRDRCSEELLKKFRVRMHSCLESIAVRCCNADSDEDSQLQQEYKQLAHSILRVSETINGALNERKTALEICTSLQTAWLLQTQRSFGLALLDPTDDPGDSEYDKELSALSSLYDINVGTGLWFMDPSKLSIWTHNLVTIRLDFEIQTNPLPAVMHKLCTILFNALHGHYALWKWHENVDSPLFRELYQELGKRRPSIWNASIQVLEECFEEYLKYVGKKRLFPDPEDDGVWLEDLEGLEDVVGLVHQFLSLESEFLKDLGESKNINDGSLIETRLEAVLKIHVRAFHIQAMNRMGLMLYHEDWSLETLDGEGEADVVIANLLKAERANRSSSSNRSKRNQFNEHTDSHFAKYCENGNPFDMKPEHSIDCDLTASIVDLDSGNAEEVLRLLNGLGLKKSVPRCVSEHALKWIARSLLIVRKLPTVATEVAEILQNITNLYVTTAFRVCAGSADHEKLLLGITSVPIPEYIQEPATPKSKSQNKFAFGMGSSASVPTSQQPIQSMTRTRDAELCAPLPCDLDSLSVVQKLIVDAQEKLQGVVKLDLVESWMVDPVREPGEERMSLVCRRARVLERRHAVAWSCVIVAAAIHLARNDIHAYSNSNEDLEAFDEYVQSLIHTIPILLDISSRTSCIRAVGGKAIVQEILNLHSVWEEAKLHEQCNNYVESVCDICSLLWWSISNSNVLPKFVLDSMWHNIVGVCYTSMIDGFARVPYCSTEGRALMSMDLTTLTMDLLPDAVFERLEKHGNAIAPPKVTLKRGMTYVDTFIKVFYFPPLDAYNWIEENYKNYHRHHAIALIAGATFASGDRHASATKRVVVKVKALYNTSKPQVAAV